MVTSTVANPNDTSSPATPRTRKTYLVDACVRTVAPRSPMSRTVAGVSLPSSATTDTAYEVAPSAGDQDSRTSSALITSASTPAGASGGVVTATTALGADSVPFFVTVCTA